MPPSGENAQPRGRTGIFLDRDGTLNRAILKDGRPLPARSLAEFELYPGTGEACRQLATLGPLIVVTNQPDVGRGDLRLEAVEEIHTALCLRLPIARVEVCYEDGRDPNSQFYKPAIGMLQRAAEVLGLDLPASIMIGDRWRDVACGRAAGCLTIWIDRGYDERKPDSPDYTVGSLPEAVELLGRIGGFPSRT